MIKIMQNIMFDLMPNRTDSEVYMNVKVDVTEFVKFMKKKPEKAMKELTEKYAGLIYAVVKSKLIKFGEYIIEDCTADVLSDFYINIDKYDCTKCSIKTWLCIIAKNKAIDILRKSKKESVSIDEIEISDENTLEGDFEEKEKRLAVIRKINELDEPDKTIMIRKYYIGQTSKEIAEILDMTVSSVDTRASRVIKRLREYFGGVTE